MIPRQHVSDDYNNRPTSRSHFGKFSVEGTTRTTVFNDGNQTAIDIVEDHRRGYIERAQRLATSAGDGAARAGSASVRGHHR